MHKRTYAETAAYLDQMRETEWWLELRGEFREFALAQGDSEEGAKIAAVLMAVVQVMIQFTSAESAELPWSWVTTYLGDDWLEAYLALGGQP